MQFVIPSVVEESLAFAMEGYPVIRKSGTRESGNRDTGDKSVWIGFMPRMSGYPDLLVPDTLIP